MQSPRINCTQINFLKLYIGEDADYILNGTTRRIAINSGAPKMSEEIIQ